MPAAPAALTEKTAPDQSAVAATAVARTAVGSLAPPPADADPAATITDKPARPEWLSKTFDAYWSDDKGIDATKLEADYGSLKNIEAEVAARKAAVPKELKDYEVGLPEGFEVPKGLSFDALADQPIVEDARAFAQKHELSKDAFKELVALSAKRDVAEYDALKTAATKQRELLGSNGNARIEAVVKGLPTALAKVIPDAGKAQKFANALLPMMFTAEQVEAFEHLIKAATGAGPKLSAVGRETQQPEQIADADYAKLSPTQKIARALKIKAGKTG